MAQGAGMPNEATLKAWLREHGLRSTRWRCEVLRILWGASAPISHQELTEALGDTEIDRATVYRNLVTLVEAELVRRIDLGDHVWRFELTERQDHTKPPQHPHFLCTVCGQVRCLDEIGMDVPSSDDSTFVASITDVVVRGFCQECN